MMLLRSQVSIGASSKTAPKFDQCHCLGHRLDVNAWSSLITAVRKTNTSGSTNMIATAIATAWDAIHDSMALRPRRRLRATCADPSPAGTAERRATCTCAITHHRSVTWFRATGRR